MQAPRAKKVSTEITQHGQIRVDNYAWLRDQNWKKFIAGDLDFADPDVITYINDENDYKDSSMESYKDVTKNLYEDILSRIKEDDCSYPFKRGDYFYYQREEKGKNYKILCRKPKSITGKEEIYFDINEEAKDHKLYSYGPGVTSDDNKFLAYFFNLTGSLEKTLKIRDLSTGRDLDWQIENCTGSFSWIDSENLYYVERDEFSRGKDVYKLNIKQGPKSAKLVFSKPEKYSNMFMGLGRTTDEEFFIIGLESGASSVTFLSKSGTEHFSEFVQGENDIKYSLDHYKGEFYICTNCDGASDFKIMTTSSSQDVWDKSHWKNYIDEKENKCITSIKIYNKFLVIFQQNNELALNQINICNLETKEIRNVEMPGDVYSFDFIGAWDFNETKMRVSYRSPIEAGDILELNLENGILEVLDSKKVPNFDKGKYIVKREYAKARDGALIPLTIIHLKDLQFDGSNKAHVYAYGSYGYGMPAYFNSSIFTLINKGFVHCIAHIRGGDDKGNTWYLDGKMDKKMNTFTDYIDSCEHLIKMKYTSKGDIAINGGSAGGLLMGAVTNMRPDLFGVVVADVAFVDVINTISDKTLPLTPPEWEEWGNPIESEVDFNYMMTYSPYDNIDKKHYPAMLYNSGISDEQVTYWEPTKMVAKLREFKTDDNLLLLNIKMHAGHAGASKKYEWIEEMAFNYSFMLKAFDLK